VDDQTRARARTAISKGLRGYTITVNVAEFTPVKALVVGLHLLHDDMRVGASPFAERLGTLLELFERGLPKA